MAFPDGWGRKQKITIQSTQVVGSGSHSDLPVLVTLDHLDTEVVDAGSNSALNGGGDIRFSTDSAGSTQLACEIVDFVINASAPGRKCEIWVKIPSVSTSSNTDFYIWYKKAGESQPAADATYGVEAVWSGYVYRTHDMLNDSTGNNTITEANAGTITDSPIGYNAYLFDGSNDYLTSTNTGLNLNQDLTFSIWARDDGNGESEPRLVQVDDGNLFMGFFIETYVGAGAIGFMGGTSGTPGEAIYATTGHINGSWGYCVNTYDQSTGYFDLFVNGIDISWDYYDNYDPPTANRITFGARTNTTNNFDGAVCEFGIRTGQISSNITATEYNMMNAPASFATAGTPEAVSGATTLVVADTSHDHSADSSNPIENINLLPDGSTHSQSSPGISITQAHQLETDDASHAQSAGACNVGEFSILATDNTYHILFSGTFPIDQVHLLDANDGYHPQIGENMLLAVASDLVIQTSLHNHVSEGLTLLTETSIQVQSSLHAFLSAGISIGYNVNLVSLNAAHNHFADQLLITQNHVFLIESSEHALTNDSLTIQTMINTAEGVHGHITETPDLSQIHILQELGDYLQHGVDEPFVRIPPGIWGFIGETANNWSTQDEASSSWTEQSEALNDWEEQ